MLRDIEVEEDSTRKKELQNRFDRIYNTLTREQQEAFNEVRK